LCGNDTAQRRKFLDCATPLCKDDTGQDRKFRIGNIGHCLQWRDVILSEVVYHPDIHLDVSGSWASQCYKRLWDPPPTQNGYEIAAKLAQEHSEEIWSLFVERIGRDGKKALYDYGPYVNHNWWLLRIEFNRVMKIPGSRVGY
jgi:hypothetical protein